MSEPLPQARHFKVDTTRPRSRSKLRSKVRHVMAVASGMSLFRLSIERAPYTRLALIFLGCGMVTLLFYAWTRAEKLRRHEISAKNRELKYRHREEAFLREEAERKARQGETPAKEG